VAICYSNFRPNSHLTKCPIASEYPPSGGPKTQVKIQLQADSSTPKVVVQKPLKTCSFLSISVQFLLKTAKKIQKSANFCSFSPSFFTQKQISPIKSHFLLPPTTLLFRKTVKNPYFPTFFSFFVLFFLSDFEFRASDFDSTQHLNNYFRGFFAGGIPVNINDFRLGGRDNYQ